MSEIEFPPLRLAVLNGLLNLKERLTANPDLLTSAECPYDAETVGILQKILEVTVVTQTVEKVVVDKSRERGRPRRFSGMSDDDMAELDKEVRDLLKDLREMDYEGAALETGEKVQIMKTRGALIDKALTNRERVFNLKAMSEFQNAVIGILDDLVDEDGREEFLNRIEPYREV